MSSPFHPLRHLATLTLLVLLSCSLHAEKPDAVTETGGAYYGALRNGKLQGQGRIEWRNGTFYEGEFDSGLFHGKGIMQWPYQMRYEGEFKQGLMSGKGRLTEQDGAVYEGDFKGNQFEGQGRYEDQDGTLYIGAFKANEPNGKILFKSKNGPLYQGEMRNWKPDGQGRYMSTNNDVYEGQFVDGDFTGTGSYTSTDGNRYKGEFLDWKYHGEGVLRNRQGDVYRGHFENGRFHGEGTLTYAKKRKNGTKKLSGIWKYGYIDGLEDDTKQARQVAAENIEQALYQQPELLRQAIEALQTQRPDKIDLYLLAVAGDGTQEVFRRETEFMRDQFDRDFDTKGRSLALINSRSTVASTPLATRTSLRDALRAFSERMDTEQDILFLFLTSHGSRDFKLSLGLEDMSLPSLSAGELATMLRDSGIRWKVVIVSACYSGGFIDALKDEQTLVITAASDDRTSFGCADENDFTQFGRTFFKEILPKSDRSFVAAFEKTQEQIAQQEEKEGQKHSLPQISAPEPIQQHLERWREQQSGAQ